MTTTAPKYHLIQAIMHSIPADDVRAVLGIGTTTDLPRRLNDFRKSELIQLLCSTPAGERSYERLQERFPFGHTGTFYLVTVSRASYTTMLVDVINALAQAGRHHGVGGNDPIRIVYVNGPPEIIPIPEQPPLLEIPLAYERRFDYFVGDPSADDYGEPTTTYRLEPAFIWLLDDHSHGIVGCSGLSALRAVLLLAQLRLDVHCSTPYMTEQMFNRLRENAQATSATYTGFPPGIPTISVHAPGLQDTTEYQELEHDPHRRSIATFVRGSIDSPFPSFGISRRYARIWTPWQFAKPRLAAAMRQIIIRTENELAEEYRTSLDDYVDYYRQLTVQINDRRLQGTKRDVFQKLMKAIVRATTIEQHEVEIDSTLLKELVQYQRELNLIVATDFDCENCGGGLGRCPQCGKPYRVTYDQQADTIDVSCPACSEKLTVNDGFLCECGTTCELLALDRHIQILPDSPLIDAVADFLAQLDHVDFKYGTFFIDGGLLRLIEPLPRTELPDWIRLDDLELWRTRAHHHQRRPDVRHLSILRKVREKCYRNGTWTTKARCQQCLESDVTLAQVYEDRQLCLPRIMGIAIDEAFDGIHHGHEIADVKYRDIVSASGIPVSVGIHLKSRNNRQKPQGEGRSTERVKALYTQVFYSAYQSLCQDNVEFQVIGISMPNFFKQDVVASLRQLLDRLGFSLLLVDEDDWLKIVGAAVEQLSFVDQLPEG